MSDITDEIKIRDFTMEDSPLVEAFFKQMGAETRSFFDRGGGNRKNAMKYFDKTAVNTVYFLAELSGEMVGYIFLWDMDKCIPWFGIAVHENLKGRGLGKKLMHHAIEYAKKHNKGGILLTTHPSNIRAQVLYESVGFERLGVHGSSGETLYLIRFDSNTH